MEILLFIEIITDSAFWKWLTRPFKDTCFILKSLFQRSIILFVIFLVPTLLFPFLSLISLLNLYFFIDDTAYQTFFEKEHAYWIETLISGAYVWIDFGIGLFLLFIVILFAVRIGVYACVLLYKGCLHTLLRNGIKDVRSILTLWSFITGVIYITSSYLEAPDLAIGFAFILSLSVIYLRIITTFFHTGE